MLFILSLPIYLNKVWRFQNPLNKCANRQTYVFHCPSLSRLHVCPLLHVLTSATTQLPHSNSFSCKENQRKLLLIEVHLTRDDYLTKKNNQLQHSGEHLPLCYFWWWSLDIKPPSPWQREAPGGEERPTTTSQAPWKSTEIHPQPADYWERPRDSELKRYPLGHRWPSSWCIHSWLTGLRANQSKVCHLLLFRRYAGVQRIPFLKW